MLAQLPSKPRLPTHTQRLPHHVGYRSVRTVRDTPEPPPFGSPRADCERWTGALRCRCAALLTGTACRLPRQLDRTRKVYDGVGVVDPLRLQHFSQRRLVESVQMLQRSRRMARLRMRKELRCRHALDDKVALFALYRHAYIRERLK